LEAFKISGTYHKPCDTIEPYLIGKGGGSAYGGKWKPSKPEDYRLIGTPGEIKISYAKDGTKIETKIGEDGRAVAERHYTTSPNPKYHSNPLTIRLIGRLQDMEFQTSKSHTSIIGLMNTPMGLPSLKHLEI